MAPTSTGVISGTQVADGLPERRLDLRGDGG